MRMPQARVIGTSSPRRQAQVLRARPDLRVVGFRGNVETRLRKLEEGVADATFLACAGLNRLGLSQHITAAMPTDVMLPAVAQGAIGIEIRADDDATAPPASRHSTTRRRRCASPPSAPTWRSSKARAARRSPAMPS